MRNSSFKDVGRIVAIGDLHGNFGGLCKILLKTGLINRYGHWIAENTHLIQLGDILGRGGEPGKIFRLLRQLEIEAPQFHSQVHVLLGNHEAMSMSGLVMYNTMEEFQDLAEQDFIDPISNDKQGDMDHIENISSSFNSSPDWKAVPSLENSVAQSGSGSSAIERKLGHAKLNRRMEMLGCLEFRKSLAPWGKVGKWLATHDSAVIINDTLFVHGGLNRAHGLQPLEILNDTVRRELKAHAVPDANKDVMLKRDGPQWNRDFTLKPNDKKGAELAEVLDYHGCLRMVVGHTPTSCIDKGQAGRILPLYDEKLLCIDTGIGKSYGENLSALSLEPSYASALYL